MIKKTTVNTGTEVATLRAALAGPDDMNEKRSSLAPDIGLINTPHWLYTSITAQANAC